MKKNNKGFGSKETFLVFIVVCMLIVVIVPFVLGYINNSKKSVVTDSIIVFRKQVDREILSYINGGENIHDGCYFVTSDCDICLGKYEKKKCSEGSLKIDIEGLKPSGGSIDIVSSKVSDIHNLLIDNRYVNEKNSEYYITLEPEIQTFCR